MQKMTESLELPASSKLIPNSDALFVSMTLQLGQAVAKDKQRKQAVACEWASNMVLRGLTPDALSLLVVIRE